MRLAVITPPHAMTCVGKLGLSYHMALATYCWDPLYVGYYRNLAMKGAHVIFDNGAAEHGESLPFDDVLSLAEAIGATEVVMPDVLLDGPKTLQNTSSWVNYVPERNRMMVPQGNAMGEWLRCLDALVALGCRSIGIPKLCERFVGGRVAALRHIVSKKLHYTHDIHLLGCYRNPSKEIGDVVELFPWVRGIDTGAPIAHAQEGLTMSYDEHEPLKWDVPAPCKYVKGNIKALLKICNGGQECI